VTHVVRQIVDPREASLVAQRVRRLRDAAGLRQGGAHGIGRTACHASPCSSAWMVPCHAIPRVFLRQSALTSALTHDLEHVRRSGGRLTRCHISAARSKPV
jgi:hypothetical protein